MIFLFTLTFVNVQAIDLAGVEGRLLLQVENKGEIWYVHPDDGLRYEVTLLNALPLFRKFALGINTEDLNKVPMLHQSISKDFGLKLKGKFLLDVENRGKIWYVDFGGFRHQIKQDTLLEIFRKLSLGITNKDLEEIPIGTLENEVIEKKSSTTQDTSIASLENDSEFKSFWELWKLIKNKYINSVDSKVLFEGAKDGLVESLGDDYSDFMTKEESSTFLKDLGGKFEGIGAEVGMKNNIYTVISPLPDSPAEKYGLKAGDQILKIDEISTLGMSLGEAIKRTKGAKGSTLILDVKHKDGLEEKLSIVRDEIIYSSLSYEIKEDNIGYIRMIRFNTDVIYLFDRAVQYMLENEVEGIILDLRNNPGGYMNMAINAAGFWIDKDVVVIEKKINETNAYKSYVQPHFKDIPSVVLVNDGSASASEIVAGALQDYGLATIVGQQTFGKGSVQELTPLSDGSYIKITTAKWYTPANRSIDGNGITPDIIVENTVEDYNNDIDAQLNKALELLK